MYKAVVLAVVALLPAELSPEGIVISATERMAIIQLIQKQDLTIQRLEKELQDARAKSGCI